VIILDTNVLSAMMRASSEPAVVRWLDGQPPESIWTTSVSVFEVRLGLSILARGRRRNLLEAAFSSAIDEDLGGRVLNFDRPAAEAAASIAAAQRRTGRPIDFRDIEIAGVALARKATLATRNTRHFEGTGVALVDPWSADA
jgi:predicted nucleic acid-binding protein